MTAAEVKRNGTRWQAWCAIHSDGINDGRRAKAQEWADEHNAKEHKGGES